MKLIASLVSVCWAAVTEYHRVGILNNKHLLLTLLECEKPKVRVSIWILAKAFFLVCKRLSSYYVCPVVGEQRERKLSHA
jgi:hypothetical protein